ncbi:MAG: histidinol-phosphatase [Candidatus Methanofastidiosum methylothiophilum]|uniref:Histidinol-phosphatase n=1 Tax=Candidatus Methanofastidiosum methylothiophilum TaxID=1705564 RepID=A0A150J5H5_9EURY|nr:MAG: histidinol-phosphatase [Candidatus Methanofastidiosum methylthiophilus]
MERLKLDFHIHSYYSPDGNMKPKDILETALSKGLDVISVTDHNSTKGGIETRDFAEEKDLPIKVIVGQEIKTISGEIIVLNLDEEIPRDMTLEETISYGKKGFIIAPHPFDKFRKGIGDDIDPIKDKINAIEIFNSRTLLSAHNKMAETYAKTNKIPGVSGSDSHFSEELGSSYFMIESKKTTSAIFKNIKEGKISIYGRQTGIKPHLKTSMIHLFK